MLRIKANPMILNRYLVFKDKQYTVNTLGETADKEDF